MNQILVHLGEYIIFHFVFLVAGIITLIHGIMSKDSTRTKNGVLLVFGPIVVFTYLFIWIAINEIKNKLGATE